ncbi:unnamed protein product [Allacma fusca]|uniref:Major facilitator superfamily (MFS) profile domain-containing protein n=1 Tax=Allacma fusca TaxID=39272 RepID=A0A8J2LAE0_9HEXA|nr:unnamed protein product [Allacma fusca]
MPKTSSRKKSEGDSGDEVTISSSDSTDSANGPSAENFEDLLKICGEAGFWQFKVFMLASFCGFMTALHNLVYAFIGAIPSHWCKLPTNAYPDYSLENLKNLTLPRDAEGEYEKCQHFGVNGNWDTGNFSLGDIDTSKIVGCDAYDYDKSIFQTTIASEWNLVCGDEGWTSTVQAMYMFGILCGSPIFGALSDKLGRKKTILMATVVFIIAAPLVALAPNFTLMMLGRFILGASSPGIYGTSYVLVIESMGMDWRGLAGNLFCLPFAVGYMALPAVAYFIRSWRPLQLALSVPAIILLLTWWLLPESPRWLIRQGRFAEAEVILRDMARSNKKLASLPSNFSELTARIADQEKQEIKKVTWKSRVTGLLAGYADLVRSPRMRVRTLVIYFSWMSISMVYYGIALNAPNLSADKYIYTFISGVLEVPSYFMVPPLIRYIGRRPVFCGFLLICGTSLLSSLAFSQGSVLIVILALFGKLVIGAAYALVYLYATEVYPTLLRTYGLGTSSMIGRIGSVLAPFIVDVVGKGNKTYPTLIFGAVSLIAGFLSILLPETRNKRLPETVKDVEENKG